MRHLLAKVFSRIPPHTRHIVDVSNMSPQERVPRDSVLLSTHKSFTYKQDNADMPFVPPDTVWVVISLPHATSSGTFLAHFSPKTGSFTKRRVRAPSPRIRYMPKKKCVVEGSHAPSRPSHSNCELDDWIIAVVARTLRLNVITHDKALKAHLRTTLAPPVAELASHARVTALRWTGERWVRHPRKKTHASPSRR